MGAEYVHSTVCTCMKYSYVIHYYVQWIYVTKYFIQNIYICIYHFCTVSPPRMKKKLSTETGCVKEHSKLKEERIETNSKVIESIRLTQA